MRMADAVGHLFADQVNHGGADAVQLFDTAGFCRSTTNALPCSLRNELLRCLENKPISASLDSLRQGSGHLHHVIRALDIDAMSLDWRDDLRANRTAFGDRFASGNLDPSRTHGSPEAATRRRSVLDEAGDAPGHVFPRPWFCSGRSNRLCHSAAFDAVNPHETDHGRRCIGFKTPFVTPLERLTPPLIVKTNGLAKKVEVGEAVCSPKETCSRKQGSM